MKANPFNFAKVFNNGGDMHYVLPHFQREYRWSQRHWQTLWDDALLTYEAMPDITGKDRLPEHFLGALVVVPDGTIHGTIPVHKLVDGQQRLTTLSLLLCALSEVVTDIKMKKRIRRLLLNADEEDDLRFKVLPTNKNSDREAYRAVIQGQATSVTSSQVAPAFDFFKKQIGHALETNKILPDVFFEVITSAFQVVFVELDKDENAYQIFESLNNKGEKLGESDLVRNYIAMRLPGGMQEQIFYSEWAPIEAMLSDKRTVGRSGLGELTAFLRHYDAMQSGILPAEKNIYARFRDAMKLNGDAAFIESLGELKRYATLYDGLLRPQSQTQAALSNALSNLNALDISTAYPFLLAVAARHENGEVATIDYITACQRLENYLVRRFLTDAPTAYNNKMFAALAGAIDWSDFVASLTAALRERNYPSDARIRQVLPTRPLYDKNNTRERTVMLFERINRHLYLGSDTIPTLASAPSLEHILPQTLSPAWKSDLGEDAEEIAREWRHTIGNLTLVSQSYNSSLSNDSFAEKRARLIEHGLKLNSDYFGTSLEQWNASTIQHRADWLTEKILEVWPSFAVTGSVEPITYTIPTALWIRGEKFAVESWRDVTRAVGEFAVRSNADFPHLAVQFPYLTRLATYGECEYSPD